MTFDLKGSTLGRQVIEQETMDRVALKNSEIVKSTQLEEFTCSGYGVCLSKIPPELIDIIQAK